MTITNGYATAAEFKQFKRITSTDATSGAIDDAEIDDLITDASRLIDKVCGRQFYASTETRLFDWPRQAGRTLFLDKPLLSVTTFLNGDGTSIAAGEYVLHPANYPAKYVIKLRDISSVVWYTNSQSSWEQVLSVTGSWGWVDRSATDPYSVQVIRNTHRACLIIAMNDYLRRFGQGQESVKVTAAGIVITPAGAMPKDAYERIKDYIDVAGWSLA